MPSTVRIIAKSSPQHIKDQYASASFCGNKYRLVVEVPYQAGIVAV